MKTINELEKQFEKEESVWKRRMNILASKHSEIMAEITDNLSVGEALSYIDMAMDVMREMEKLDSKHKKFLLKWYNKFKNRTFLDTLRIIFHKGD